ncbi:hypothetical protein [Allorhodopirellula heiligendammensis]|uniref:Uncharacterized protein n=1 Tax=Allorhodopirellula heiligendammensis TaxID=2714739 RepID=A0A5C6C6T9_9BACT|nr:hypothetical protein [Allorhodopirellula heiligendammensis]TWU19186.1 hypothetical protein Poly21_13570 [Allorhodopirellula heiligendammensis]
MSAPAKTFLIHVQPDQLLALDELDILNVAKRLELEWVEECSATMGDDDGRYINIHIHSNSPAETWARIADLFLGTDFLSTEIRISSIVTVTGDAGWDDYLLLHHFDPSEELDQYA